MLRFWIRSVMVASIGATGFYSVVLLNYAFEVLEQIAMLLVIVVGFWVGGWVFLILRLQKSERAAVKAFGEALGVGMLYTALLQGIIYTVLVFMVIGYGAVGTELPESRTIFMQDLLVGASYIAVLVFGASGATVIFTYYRPRTRLLAVVYSLIGVVVPVIMLWTGWLTAQVAQYETLTLVGFVGFTLLMSVLLMTLVGSVEDPSYQRKVELRRRLKKR